MKKILFLLLLSEFAFGQTPTNDPHWQLVWEDDFNTLNTDIWEVVNNFDHYSGLAQTFSEGEPQVYTNRTDNVFISNGNLILRLKSENYSCPSSALSPWGCSRQNVYGVPYNYTSGWVETKQAYNTQYGYIESRIKLPNGNGFWPAFWTFVGNGVSENNAAEIDVFEMLGDLSSFSNLANLPADQVATTNIHRDYCPPNCPQPDYFSALMMSSYTNWHVYAVEWSPSKIIWYIDGYPVRIFPNHGIIDPVRILLNFAVQPNHNPTSLPADMLIDYVKVYELNSDCNDFINATNYDFSTYDNFEKNFIKIGQGGGNNSLSNGQDIKLRASQFIEISGDFHVPIGASLYLDANKDCFTDLGLQCTQTFNPCVYDFLNYDNSIKKIIDLGNNGCSVNVVPVDNDIILQATDDINLGPGVSITPTENHTVHLKIVPCD